jgi:hypothetical protein
VRADLDTLLIAVCCAACSLWRAIAYELPGFHDSLSLVDTTPLPCAQSIATVNRSQLAPWRGFGYSAAHSRFYWGMRLVLWCGPDGCVRDFDLVPANAGEREAVLELLERHPPATREPRTDWSAASPRASSPSPRPSTSTGSSACHREP